MAKEAVPNEIPKDCDMATEAGPNKKPNDWYMSTELVPKVIKNDRRAYRIVYRMASQETVEITSKKSSRRSHSDGYHCRRTSHGAREDYREPYRTKPLTETLTEGRTEGSKTIAERHTELNAKLHDQRPIKCLLIWPQESRPRTY